jgi:hypothetical protein
MMPKGRARHMFPGGNTSQGFFSFYSYIMSQEEAKRIFILKGGPGVGKSTFMKKIANEMLNMGYDVEYMHCSSDSNSLDGVVIPAIGIALMDGTAPHVVDPKTPGAVDEIINLGDCWNERGIAGSKSEILKLSNEISARFQRAYRYLMSAGQMHDDIAALSGRALNEGRVNRLADELINSLFDGIPVSVKPGRQRCLFASAITPDGIISYLDDLIVSDSIYKFSGYVGAGMDKVLEKLKTAAMERGFFTEAFYCPLKPWKLEHLIIPEINTAFTTVNKYHYTDACAIRSIDFSTLLDNKVLDPLRQEIEYDENMLDKLLDKAVDIIHGAKGLHDELESYYIPNMDFPAIESKQKEIMRRILEYAQETK